MAQGLSQAIQHGAKRCKLSHLRERSVIKRVIEGREAGEEEGHNIKFHFVSQLKKLFGKKHLAVGDNVNQE